jgi:hypothetical protein
MKDFDPIDQYIQKRIDQTDVSYSDQFWIDFQDKLPVETHSSFISRLKKWLIKSKILHVASIVIFLASAFYFTKNKTAEDVMNSDFELSNEISEDGQLIESPGINIELNLGDNASKNNKTEQKTFQNNHINDSKRSNKQEYDPSKESEEIPPMLNTDSVQEHIMADPADSLKNEQNSKKKKHLIW